jgi:hypothetical protein
MDKDPIDKDLACPTATKTPFERKRQFPELSNRCLRAVPVALKGRLQWIKTPLDKDLMSPSPLALNRSGQTARMCHQRVTVNSRLDRMGEQVGRR